jgi:hypothetical protein
VGEEDFPLPWRPPDVPCSCDVVGEGGKCAVRGSALDPQIGQTDIEDVEDFKGGIDGPDPLCPFASVPALALPLDAADPPDTLEPADEVFAFGLRDAEVESAAAEPDASFSVDESGGVGDEGFVGSSQMIA